MMRCTCQICSAYYYAPDARPEKLPAQCKECGSALRVVYLTDEDFEAETAAPDTLADIQARRAHAAEQDARAYRGGLAGWGVQV